VEKIKAWFKKNYRYIIAVFTGVSAVVGYTIVVNRKRERITDQPIEEHDSREGSVDRVNDLIYSGLGSALERPGGNLDELQDHEQRIGELYRQAEITAQRLAEELAVERSRNGELTNRLQRLADTVGRVGWSLDGIERIGERAQEISGTIADTIEEFERKLNLGNAGDREPEIEPVAVGDPDGVIEGIVSEPDGGIPPAEGSV